MAYFNVTSTNGQAAIINGNAVTKVLDTKTHRIIYQGSETNNHQVKETLDSILNSLRNG
jgi:hypothetical protein